MSRPGRGKYDKGIRGEFDGGYRSWTIVSGELYVDSEVHRRHTYRAKGRLDLPVHYLRLLCIDNSLIECYGHSS